MATTTTKTKVDLEKENTELKDNLTAMQEQIKALMQELESLSAPKRDTNTSDITRRKVDVISLLDCPAILSTEPHGAGTVYQFAGYGTVRKIRFSDLEKIVNVTKQIAFDVGMEESFFERGCFYIADAEVVEELGLGQAYEKILNKSKVDEMVELKNHHAIEIFKGANESIKETVVSKIINQYNAGVKYDRNLLAELSSEYGKDIIELATQSKKIKAKNM